MMMSKYNVHKSRTIVFVPSKRRTDVCTISISRRGNGRAASVKMEKDVGLTEEPRK